MKKNFVKIFAVVACILMLLPMSASAVAYVTYTYSIDGEQLASPHAYTPVMQMDSTYMNLPEALNNARRPCCGREGQCVYCGFLQ